MFSEPESRRAGDATRSAEKEAPGVRQGAGGSCYLNSNGKRIDQNCMDKRVNI